MGNGAQKPHGPRAETPECLERDGRKLMAGAVMTALVRCGFGGVATARCVTGFGRSAVHISVGEGVDEGNVAQDVAWAGANMRVEIPARLRVVECASAAASVGALSALGKSRLL